MVVVKIAQFEKKKGYVIFLDTPHSHYAIKKKID